MTSRSSPIKRGPDALTGRTPEGLEFVWAIGEPKNGYYPVTWNEQSKLCVRVTGPLDLLPKGWAFAWAANKERVLMLNALADVLGTGWQVPRSVLIQGLRHYASIEDLKADERNAHYDPGTCPDCKPVAELRQTVGEVRAHATKTKYAADLGTYMHYLIEVEVRKMLGLAPRPRPKKVLTKGQQDAAEWGLISWQGWANEVEFKPVRCELRGFHWADAYAGTFDALGYVRDELAIVDWKSSVAVYDSHHIQTGRYYDMLVWMYENDLLDFHIGDMSDEGWILRLPKDEQNTEFEAVRALPAVQTRGIYRALLALHREYEALGLRLRGAA